MHSGCCCCYQAINFHNLSFLCVRKAECLCCVHGECLSLDTSSLGVGATTNEENKECINISLPFCRLGLKTPGTVCRSADRFGKAFQSTERSANPNKNWVNLFYYFFVVLAFSSYGNSCCSRVVPGKEMFQCGRIQIKTGSPDHSTTHPAVPERAVGSEIQFYEMAMILDDVNPLYGMLCVVLLCSCIVLAGIRSYFDRDCSCLALVTCLFW
jgi:hypothetical protein